MDNVIYFAGQGSQAAASAAGVMGGTMMGPQIMPMAAAPFMGPAAIVVFVLGALVLFGFWIWMLVHAIRHEIKDQALWILILMLTNFWGAVIYYFAVKHKMDSHIHHRNKQVL